MAEVVFKNVVKAFGAPNGARAVDDLSFAIKDREFAVLVGSSGCGKTTALRMIAGLETATSGDIFIDGQRVNDIPPRERDIAMVFQSYALYPHMNLRENMGFGLKVRGFSTDEIKKRVDEAAEILGLTSYLERKPKELSGGQRQRVAVGRAIVRRPKVFLFDEPLSNLDAKLRVAMRAEISKLHKKLAATMIYVTHDQVEAMTMADRIYIMSNGLLQQAGSPMEVYKQPKNQFVAGFIGSPAMNFVDAKIIQKDGKLWIDAGENFCVRAPDAFLPQLTAHENKAVIFGVRPEDMRLADENANDQTNCIACDAEVVELLGAEIFAHLRTNASSELIVARMEVPKRAIQIGEKIQLMLTMENTHVFLKDGLQTIV